MPGPNPIAGALSVVLFVAYLFTVLAIGLPSWSVTNYKVPETHGDNNLRVCAQETPADPAKYIEFKEYDGMMTSCHKEKRCWTDASGADNSYEGEVCTSGFIGMKSIDPQCDEWALIDTAYSTAYPNAELPYGKTLEKICKDSHSAEDARKAAGAFFLLTLMFGLVALVLAGMATGGLGGPAHGMLVIVFCALCALFLNLGWILALAGGGPVANTVKSQRAVEYYFTVMSSPTFVLPMGHLTAEDQNKFAQAHQDCTGVNTCPGLDALLDDLYGDHKKKSVGAALALGIVGGILYLISIGLAVVASTASPEGSSVVEVQQKG